MKYLVVPALDALTTKMTKCDLGDYIINGRIEAYSCKRAGQDKRVAKKLASHYKTLASSPVSGPSSPLGPLALPSTRKLLISLITTMNNTFPDYDFSELRPDQFTEKKLKDVVDSLNSLFLDLMDRTVKGFRAQFWKTLDEVIQTTDSQVFTYVPGFGSSSGTLWSTNYFFFSKKLKKIVFFMVSAASKLSLVSQEESEVDADLSDVEMEEEEVVEETSDSPVRGYVDVDLLDMDDLGLESIDIPESTWVSDNELARGSLVSFAEEKEKTKKSSKSSNRSIFSDSGSTGSQTSSVHSNTLSLFSDSSSSSIISIDEL